MDDLAIPDTEEMTSYTKGVGYDLPSPDIRMLPTSTKLSMLHTMQQPLHKEQRIRTNHNGVDSPADSYFPDSCFVDKEQTACGGVGGSPDVLLQSKISDKDQQAFAQEEQARVTSAPTELVAAAESGNAWANLKASFKARTLKEEQRVQRLTEQRLPPEFRTPGEYAGGKTPVTVIKVAKEFYKPNGMELEVLSTLTVSQAKEKLKEAGVLAAADRLARLLPPSGFLLPNETFQEKNITEVSFEGRLLGGMPGGGSSSGAGASSSASGANGCPDHIHPHLRAALHVQHPNAYSLAHNTTDVPTIQDLNAAFSLLVSNSGPSIASDIFDPSVLSAVNQNKDQWVEFLSRRQQEDAVRRVRQRSAEELRAAEQQRPTRAPLLSELTDYDYESYLETLEKRVELKHRRLTDEVNTLLPHGWKELLRIICDSHRGQQFSQDVRMKDRRVTSVNIQCINGDFQRGKSTVEGLVGVITWAIHQSVEVGDKCCTLVVTQLQAWANALKDTFETKTAVPARRSSLPMLRTTAMTTTTRGSRSSRSMLSLRKTWARCQS